MVDNKNSMTPQFDSRQYNTMNKKHYLFAAILVVEISNYSTVLSKNIFTYKATQMIKKS